MSTTLRRRPERADVAFFQASATYGWMAMIAAVISLGGGAAARAQEAAGKAPEPQIKLPSVPKAEGEDTHFEPPCDCDVWCGLFVAMVPGSERAKAATESGKVLLKTEQPLVMEQLAKAFPDFAGFEVIGESSEPILKEYECWVVPTDKLFIKIDSLGEDPEKRGGVHVHLQIWHETDVVLKSDAILRENPIFFAGPKWGEDRLILALKLTAKAEPAPEE